MMTTRWDRRFGPSAMIWLSLACATAVGAQAEGGSPSAIAPPVAQQTADCARPTYATDQLVCTDAALLALDTQLAEMITVRGQAVEPGTPWREEQKAWFDRRSRCAFLADHRGCVAAAYQMRLVELRALASPPGAGNHVRCVPDLAVTITGAGELGSRSLLDRSGRIALVAFPTGRGPWQPFVTWQARSKTVRISSLDGTTIASCELERRDL
ncbi:hypothetical protein [Sphingomonas solaris]|uniref:DUF1311 domain-containing protein n=1 Tax=Alterirhizorhabdus solaris TaxID=2529389 RepID=A0A558QVD2_9SPHN|nr:hypothetical protein [Sphingomonas solaris]TVV71022.1 hypothetical protein FOY91_17725 [Sphingomonas solaris]